MEKASITKDISMRSIRESVVIISVLFSLVGFIAQAQRMPIYVLPWYNSEPLTIQVGKFSEKLKTEDVQQLQIIADEINKEIDHTSIETLYVLAIRFYDLGQKEEAIYWFYTARFRQLLYAKMVENVGGIGESAFEFKQAQNAFRQLAGEYINGYAGGIPDRLIEIISKVSDEGISCGYIGLAYPNLSFKPYQEQAVVARRISISFLELKQYIIDNREYISKTRKEQGIEGKY